MAYAFDSVLAKNISINDVKTVDKRIYIRFNDFESIEPNKLVLFDNKKNEVVSNLKCRVCSDATVCISIDDMTFCDLKSKRQYKNIRLCLQKYENKITHYIPIYVNDFYGYISTLNSNKTFDCILYLSNGGLLSIKCEESSRNCDIIVDEGFIEPVITFDNENVNFEFESLKNDDFRIILSKEKDSLYEATSFKKIICNVTALLDGNKLLIPTDLIKEISGCTLNIGLLWCEENFKHVISIGINGILFNIKSLLEESKTILDYEKDFDKLYAEKIGFKRRAMYGEYRSMFDIDEKTVLYTSFHGRGMICNPYAIFKYLLSKEEFSDFKHIWVLDDYNNHIFEIDYYDSYDNVTFVEMHSEEYMMALASAKYVITNVTEQSYFAPKDGQVVINTWHGIPLKKIGYDIPNGEIASKNSVRNMLLSDYLVSANAFTTDNYKHAFKLDGIYDGKIIETGYPRCDCLINDEEDSIIDRFSKFGLDIDPNKTLILYAPTWRGDEYSNPNIDLEMELGLYNHLIESLDSNRFQVLFKPHQVVYRYLMEKNLFDSNFVPAIIDTNELLSVTDILITDYSSIFFDFLITNKPILFYVPDFDNYKNDRGTYFELSDLPGPVTTSETEVCDWVVNLGNGGKYDTLFDGEKYTRARNKYSCNDDGCASERVVKSIFKNDNKWMKKICHDKKRLLFHLDGMHKNGITVSLVNLINRLNFDKYDVTLYAILIDNDPHFLNLVDKRVRILVREGAPFFTREEYAKRSFCFDKLISIMDNSSLFPKDFFVNEYIRCFGKSRFDVIINYSGYSGYWSNVYLSEKNAKKYVWMHSDLVDEQQKVVNGKRIHYKNLTCQFKCYEGYDKIIGCSKLVAEINRNKINNPKIYKKYKFVNNLVDIDKIEKNLKDVYLINYLGNDYYFDEIVADGKQFTLVNSVMIPLEENINFVTMGRFFPEKNHKNMILAFSRINKLYPNTRLYIVGEGPLKDEYEKMIKDLSLTNSVILTGQLKNPFYLMSKCDCFVLPSLHEGAPIVLLEARALNLPLVFSRFSTHESCLIENGQYLIDMDVNSIFDGFKEFINGNVPSNYDFNVNRYNEKCLSEFYGIL